MTTPENQNTTQQELEPFFPPIVLFAVSMIAFFVALVVWMTQGSEFHILGWGALVVGIIAFVFWLVMNPKAVMDFVKGRGLAFGGTAIVVSIVLVIAAVLLYTVIAAQSWSLDYTEGNVLTVAENTRDVLETIANDPTAGNVRFVAFFSTQDAAGRERFDILLRDMEQMSGGKVSYEYVDPDRDPFVAQQYGDAIRSGQIAVVPYDTAGNLVIDEAELLTNPDQYSLTNTVIKVLAGGDFRATFVNLPDGVDPEDAGQQGAGTWVTYLRDTLGWTVNIITPLELTTEAGLGELASDGDVLIIPGGVDALPDEAIAVITDYVNRGGNLVLYAGPNLALDPTLAAADNMSAFLQASFGVRVRDDLVVDDAEHFSLEALQLISENYNSHPITEDSMTNGLLAVFSAPQSIEVVAPAPDGVTVTQLVTTTENAYAKTGIDVNAQIEQNVPLEAFQELFAQAEGDITGALALAVAAENTSVSSRLVVFASDSIIWNGFDGSRGELNPFLTQRAIFWTTGFDEFAASLATVRPLDETPPDEVVIDVSDVQYIRFITVLLIPFGSLIIGIAIWWVRRERINA